MILLAHIRRYAFTILGVVLAIALWGFLFLRNEETRRSITKVERRVTIVERSPCSGLTARACVTALVAALSDRDLSTLSHRLDDAHATETTKTIRQEVQRQLRDRQKQRTDRRAPDRHSGGSGTGGSGTATPPFRPNPPASPAPGPNPGPVIPAPGVPSAPPAPAPNVVPRPPSEPGPIPPVTVPTPPSPPAPSAPPVVQTPSVTVPPIGPLPPVTVPPITVPCIPLKPLINC